MNNITLALDPSGNYNEGKGTTGYCYARDGYIFKAGQIYAAEYSSQMEYWEAVLNLIKQEINGDYDAASFEVVCEDYRLYASASEAQINSNLETPQLIGAIRLFCYQNDIKITMQMAAEVKKRWSNDVMVNKHLLQYDPCTRKYHMGNLYLNNHSLDAVRHCLHYITFKAKTRAPKEVYERNKRNKQQFRNNRRTTYRRRGYDFYD